MRKRDLFRFGFGDLIGICGAGHVGWRRFIRTGGRCFACIGLFYRIAVCLEDRAVGSLDLIVVCKASGGERYFVNSDTVFGIIVRGKVADVFGAQTGIV